jgi:hypothetical protein
MKWFEKWIEQKYYSHQEKREREINKMGTAQAIPKGLISIDRGPNISQNGIRFTVYKATGGVAIETQMYDERNDRHRSSLYVITSDKDIGEEIGKIITLEALKN